MILFGGEQEGQTLNDLWRFHFGKPTPHYIVVTTVIQLHCGYHSYLTKLYVGSALVSAMYGRSSELG